MPTRISWHMVTGKRAYRRGDVSPIDQALEFHRRRLAI
jgi:hypothetical protein